MSEETKIRNYIAGITAGKFLQDYAKNPEETRIMAIAIAREKKYIGSTSTDLSLIPPFMFYQVIEESIKAIKPIIDFETSYNKTKGVIRNSLLFDNNFRKYVTKYKVTSPIYTNIKKELLTPEKIRSFINLLNEVYMDVKTHPNFIKN